MLDTCSNRRYLLLSFLWTVTESIWFLPKRRHRQVPNDQKSPQMLTWTRFILRQRKDRLILTTFTKYVIIARCEFNFHVKVRKMREFHFPLRVVFFSHSVYCRRFVCQKLIRLIRHPCLDCLSDRWFPSRGIFFLSPCSFHSRLTSDTSHTK